MNLSEPPSDREVVVERLGGLGDGIARLDGSDVYIPFGLPGERWRLGEGGRAFQRLTDSPDRVAPPCPHFGLCGGCSMQHVSAEAYAGWKRSLVVDALERVGIAVQVDGLRTVPAASRRRAVLTGALQAGGAVVGFHMARDHAVVDVPECRILQPEIVAALPMLQRLSRRLGGNGKTIRLTVLSTLTSLDVTVEGEKLPLTLSTNAELAELANEACWARLTVGGREIVTRNRPELEIGGVRVIPPPGAFVQAVAEAEAIMQDCVVAALGRSRNVADLYAGLGTLTFPIARTAQVLAVDSDAAALAALEQAERHARGLKPIVTRRRDLLREPLARKELEPFDCVVFDPPRAGAKAQAEMLAGSLVPLVVAVSCSPATLARDLAILQDGGFVIERVTPIDQFVFTSHVEAVAIARRPGRRRRG